MAAVFFPTGSLLAQTLLQAVFDGDAELVVATHNKTSCQLTMKRMRMLGLDPASSPVHFAQLLGMRDDLTYSLAGKGYRYASSL